MEHDLREAPEEPLHVEHGSREALEEPSNLNFNSSLEENIRAAVVESILTSSFQQQPALHSR